MNITLLYRSTYDARIVRIVVRDCPNATAAAAAVEAIVGTPVSWSPST